MIKGVNTGMIYYNNYKYIWFKQKNSKIDEAKLTELKGKIGKSTIKIRDFYIPLSVTGRTASRQKNQ